MVSCDFHDAPPLIADQDVAAATDGDTNRVEQALDRRCACRDETVRGDGADEAVPGVGNVNIARRIDGDAAGRVKARLQRHAVEYAGFP